MRLLALSSLALAISCGTGELRAEGAAPLSPEAQIQAPLQALRNNDIEALFKLAPPEKQAEALANWKNAGAKAPEEQRAKLDTFFATMLAPNAVDSLLAIAEPQLKMVNPQELVGYVQMFGGMAAMQMAQDPKTAELGKHLQQLVTDVATWLPTAGIEDPQKLREVLNVLVDGVKSLGVASADEVFALEFNELLKRGGLAIKTTKSALKVYGLEADQFLDSIKVVDVQGTGDTRTATAHATAFGHAYALPLNLVLVNGQWEVKDNVIEQGLEGLAPTFGGGQGL